jgi:DNA-binding transcriptional MerR regulator
MSFTVKAVADLAGISVRTLHHYDAIGLLKPATISPAGYRLYAVADLERLQQILFFRELDVSLPEIQAIMDRPDFDRRQALISHRHLLSEKQKRLETLIQSVDRTLAALERGTKMDASEMFTGFDDKQLQEWQEEARQRWGPEHVDESIRRTSTYTKEDWAGLQGEMQAIGQGLADCMAGDPGAPEAQAWVEKWFRLINEHFYDCSLAIFRGLGDLYVDDPRFTATYDKIKPGLAQFKRAAMHVYCDRMEGKA